MLFAKLQLIIKGLRPGINLIIKRLVNPKNYSFLIYAIII